MLNLAVAFLLCYVPGGDWDRSVRAASELGIELDLNTLMMPREYYTYVHWGGRMWWNSIGQPNRCQLCIDVEPMAPPYDLLDRPYPLRGAQRNVAYAAWQLAVDWTPAPPRTGIPIGDVDAILDARGLYTVRSFVDKSFFVITCSARWAHDDRGYSTQPYEVPVADRMRMETLTRWLISDYRAYRRCESTKISVAGAMLYAIRVEDSAVAQCSLGDWALLSGWMVRLNHKSGIVTMTKGSHTILAPVGTNAMKVDGKWIRTRGVTFYKNGTYYADVANLP